MLALDAGICLVCRRPLADLKSRASRGDHQHCYKQVQRFVEASELTEFDAVEKGTLAPAESGGRSAFSTGRTDSEARESARPGDGASVRRCDRQTEDDPPRPNRGKS